MNILYINHYAGSPQHGMEYRPYYLAREWVRAGHAVRMLAASYSHVRAQQPDLAAMHAAASHAPNGQMGQNAHPLPGDVVQEAVEEAGAKSGADTNVFDRSGLPRGKVGGLSPGDRGDAGGGTEEEALDELHLVTSKRVSRPSGFSLPPPQAF